MSAHILQAAVDEFVNAYSSGLLIWSLRGHSRHGGYIVHAENGGYFSYHYPGFPQAEGFHADEEKVFEIVEKSYCFNEFRAELKYTKSSGVAQFQLKRRITKFTFQRFGWSLKLLYNKHGWVTVGVKSRNIG